MSLVGLQGIYHSVSFIALQRAEKSVAAGANVLKTGSFQALEALVASHLANLVFVAAGLQPFSWSATAVIVITPILIAYAKEKNWHNLEPLWTFLHHHANLFYQVVAITSAVSLIFLGYSTYGLMTLSLLLLGYLDQKGWIPEKTRQWLHAADTPLSCTLGVFLESWKILRVLMGLNLLFWGFEQCPSQSPVTVACNQLTFEKAQHIVSYPATANAWTINPAYIQEEVPFKHPPPTDYTPILLKHFDAIAWTADAITTLRIKLTDNERFQLRLKEEHLTMEALSDAQCIQRTRDSLKRSLQETKDHEILDGEIKDYGLLEAYLSWIALICEKREKSSHVVTNSLLVLAIDCGLNCGTRRFQYAEDLCLNLLYENKKLPVRAKTLYLLQNLRERQFQTIYHLATNTAWMRRFFFISDLHTFNFFKNFYGQKCGLRMKAVDNDETVKGLPLFEQAYSSVIKFLFLKIHTANTLVQELDDLIPTPQFPTEVFYRFWMAWIDRQALSEEAKAELSYQFLTKNQFLGVPVLYDEEKGKVNPLLLQLMLLDMGILRSSS